jgi:hypothetical protein
MYRQKASGGVLQSSSSALDGESGNAQMLWTLKTSLVRDSSNPRGAKQPAVKSNQQEGNKQHGCHPDDVHLKGASRYVVSHHPDSHRIDPMLQSTAI